MKSIITATLLLFATACITLSEPTATQKPSIPTPQPSNTSGPTMTNTPEPTPSSTPTPQNGNSEIMPVTLATVEAAAIQVCEDFSPKFLLGCLSPSAYLTYAAGIESGNNPHAFIVLGDSNSVPAVFMGQYEYCCAGEFGKTAEWFAGSFGYAHSLRQNGLSVMDFSLDLLSQEINQHNPSLAFIALDSNTGGSAEKWAQRYEMVVMALIEDFHVLPVIWTITDMPLLSVEIRAIAEKYGLPLVEWASIGQPYLSEDGVHFTVEGWAFRGSVGLEVLSQLLEQIDLYEGLISREN